jgi:hypothetical protein
MELTRLMELTAGARISMQLIQEAKKAEQDFDGIRAIVEDALGDLDDKLGRAGSLKTLFKTSGAEKLDSTPDESGETVLSQIIAKTREYKRQIEKLMTEAELLISQTADDKEPVTEAKKNFTDQEQKSKGWYHKGSDKETVMSFGNKMSSKNKAGKHADKNGGTVHYGYMDDKTGRLKNLKQAVTEAKEYSDSSEFTNEFYEMMKDIADFKKTVKNPRWMAWLKATDDNFGTDCQTPGRAAITAINTLDAQLNDIDAEFDKADA